MTWGGGSTTNRPPWHYNSSTCVCVIPPLEWGCAMCIEKISYFNAYPPPLPFYVFANLSTEMYACAL